MRHEQMFAPFQCLTTMHSSLSLAYQTSTLPFFLTAILVLNAQNEMSTLPLTMHMQNVNYPQACKNIPLPPHKLIFYIPKLFLKENSHFKTIIKNIWQWSMNNNSLSFGVRK